MKFWNYIGAFFLFRWLFGSDKHDETKGKCAGYDPAGSADRDYADDLDSYIGFGMHYDNSFSRIDDQDYGFSQSYDDFHDGYDDYDLMDDDF